MDQTSRFIPPRSDLDFLVESIPNPMHGEAKKTQKFWPAIVIPLIFSLAAAAICYRVTGPTLGLFLGGIFAAVLLTGPLTSAETNWVGRLFVWLGAVHGIAAVWFYAAIHNHLNLVACSLCYLMLNALCLSLAAMTWTLRRLGMGLSGAAAIVTVAAMAWLLWPIWLSPILAGTHGEKIVNILTPIHPIMAINAMLRPQLGYWAEQSIAYHYTNLSDDINYSLPTSILPCVLFHLAVAGIFLGVVGMLNRFIGRSSTVA